MLISFSAGHYNPEPGYVTIFTYDDQGNELEQRGFYVLGHEDGCQDYETGFTQAATKVVWATTHGPDLNLDNIGFLYPCEEEFIEDFSGTPYESFINGTRSGIIWGDPGIPKEDEGDAVDNYSWYSWQGPNVGGCHHGNGVTFMWWPGDPQDPHHENIGFVKPSVLLGFSASSTHLTGDLTVTTYDENGQQLEQLFVEDISSQVCLHIATNFTLPASRVNIHFTTGADLVLDNIQYCLPPDLIR